MHRVVAAGAPAAAFAQMRSVVFLADPNVARRHAGSLHLRVTLEAQIGVTLHEHFPVHRTVRVVAGDAALAHRLMFKDEWPCLLAMTRRTTVVDARHRQSGGGLERVRAMRIVALHAVHLDLDDRMMLGQAKFRVSLEMALEARFRILARIDNKAPSAAGFHMLAARAVAGFTASLTGHLQILRMKARVWTGGKTTGNVRVTLGARLVADEVRSFNLRRLAHCARDGRTRAENETSNAQTRERYHTEKPAPVLHKPAPSEA